MHKLFAQIDRQAWIRFFVGLGGLLAAFVCALLSTALRESGYPIFADAFASFALLAAGAVGLYTVPYLAKRVARERWIDAFEYEITKDPTRPDVDALRVLMGPFTVYTIDNVEEGV